MSTDDKSRKEITGKSVKQQIASAQMHLNRLKTKEKSFSKRAETRLNIIFGAEVAKSVGCKVEDVDKELVLGFLKDINCLNDCDIIKYKKKGRAFLLDMVGR